MATTPTGAHEWSRMWHHHGLNIRLLHASHVQHAYPRHSHDYYVVCVIESGLQSFSHGGATHMTPPGGVILINPGAAHTGEPADRRGFVMRSLYPTSAHLEAVYADLTGSAAWLPSFRQVRIDDRYARDSIVGLHRALADNAPALECESRFMLTCAYLLERYADLHGNRQRIGREQAAIQRARRLIDECFAEGLSLQQLAAHVGLSPYYLLRAFRAETGMPPHAYQESVRIHHAQHLIDAGCALAEIAAAVGFSSQSHFNQRFKRVLGVTPGQYARERHT